MHSIEVLYLDNTRKLFHFNATNTRMRDYWMAVLEEHERNDTSMPWHPGRLKGSPDLTPLQRAEAIAGAFGGAPPAISKNFLGYNTTIKAPGPKGPGVVEIRSSDAPTNPEFAGGGPYFRADVQKGGQGGYLNFDGKQDKNAHFYLGSGGEQNDLPLQIAMVGKYH
jgi:hypothetical protein